MRWSRTYLLFIFFFSFITASAQKNDGLKHIVEADSVIASFEKDLYYKDTKFPFRDIVVFDKRFDTTKCGYTNTDIKIKLQHSWTNVLTNYFRNNLDPASDRSLVIFIRSYWLQKGILDNVLDKKVIQKQMNSTNTFEDYSGSCTVQLEVYAGTGSSLKTLFKIDTSFLNATVGLRRGTLDRFFFLPFDSMARKIAMTDIPELLTRRKDLSWQEVHQHYDNRFNVQVLHDASIRKGIFLTFEDFKKNKPWVTDFKFSNGKKTDELYTTGNGGETLVSKYWGFYDGENLFIQSSFSAFKAVRQQNTFEIFGAKHVSNYLSNPGPYDIQRTSTGVERRILQLNMDTGKLY